MITRHGEARIIEQLILVKPLDLLDRSTNTRSAEKCEKLKSRTVLLQLAAFAQIL